MSSSPASSPASDRPARAGLVLAALIVVAAVANLGLAVANVALPSIGDHFDASQTALNLIAVGYSLGLAASVLYLGAVGDRYGRKLLLVLGMVLTVPADCLAAWAPSEEVLIVARILGGLAAGLSTAIRLAKPGCRVFGVEPFGADTMYRSFAAGSPQSIDRIDTIADSLGAPYALPISYALCRASIAEVVRIEDREMVAAMRFLLENARLAVEPAGAAATAALLGPLRERLAGRRVGLIVCGSNIAAEAYARLISG